MKPQFNILTPALIASLSLAVLAEEHEKLPASDQAPATTQPVQRSADSTQSTQVSLLVKASDIIGLEARNNQEEKLGKIDDVVVDFGAGRVTGLLVGVGGILGVGDKPVMVPMSSFHYDAQQKVLHLDSTKDVLKAAPRFEIGKWEEFKQQPELAEVYRYHGATPYFGEGAKDVDNTVHNRRDRDSRALLPEDQGNTPADLGITKQIRQEVLKQDDLSVNAQNIKIITVNGLVTLRGVVNSEHEKQAVFEIAERAAQPGNVDNQLKVKGEVSRN